MRRAYFHVAFSVSCWLGCLVLLAWGITTCATVPACATCSAAAPTNIGVNMSELVTYGSGLELCNRIRQSGNWSAILGATLPLYDANGWPTGWSTGGELILNMNREINADVAGVTSATPGHYPGGVYHMTWSGTATTGDLDVDIDATGFAVTSAGHATFNVQPTHEGFRLRLKTPARIPTNVVITADATPCNGQWRAGLITDLAGFSPIRFMDWGRTNNSPTGTWASRPSTTHYTLATTTGFDGGVPWEDMIDFANTVGSDAWFNIPDQADDTYVTNMVTLVCSTLTPGKIAGFEVGNEIWNCADPAHPASSIFCDAHNRAQAAGVARGYADDPAWYRWQLARTMEVQIAAAAHCGANQYAIKLNIQNAGPQYSCSTGLAGCLSYTYMDFNPPDVAGTTFKATPHLQLVVAPYLNLEDGLGALYSLNSGNAGYDGQTNAACVSAGQGPGGATLCCTGAGTGTCDATNFRGQTPAQWQSSMRAGIYSPLANTATHVTHATAAGLTVGMYEGGTHITLSGGGAEGDATLVAAKIAAEGDPGMRDVIREYLAAVKATGIDFFVYFQAITRDGKFFDWGLCRFYDTCATEPKYLAAKAASDAF